MFYFSRLCHKPPDEALAAEVGAELICRLNQTNFSSKVKKKVWHHISRKGLFLCVFPKQITVRLMKYLHIFLEIVKR